MKKRTSSGCFSGKVNMEMGSNIDLSLLRRPLTPFTGFQEAKSAFDKGTVEVRHLLLYECGLIYECNVCRNMFRSLANFISHKRVFCCTSYKDYNGTHNPMNGSDGIHSAKHHSREYMLAKHDSELRQKITESKEINSNKQIPFSEPTAIIDVEAEDKQLLHEKIEGTNQNKKPTKATEKKRDDNTKPTDQIRYKNKEIPSPTFVFQCPSCSLTFLKSSAVICHLAIAHNIPIRRIRMMRDSLLKCRTEPTKIENVDKPKSLKKNRELRGLLMNESSSSGVEDKRDPENDQTESKCFFCQKSFDRRAVLATHMQNCLVKNDILENQEQAVAAPIEKHIKLEMDNQELPKEAAIAADADCQIIDHKQKDTQSVLMDEEDVKRTFVDLEKQTFGAGLQTVSLDKLDISAEESSNASLVAEKNVPEAKTSDLDTPELSETTVSVSADISSTTTNNESSIMSIKKRRMRSTNAQYCRCKICGKQFNALSNLRRHISMFHYRARKFGCALCDYCAFRRYDIINHLNFVHKLNTVSDTMSKDLVRVNDVPYTKDDMNDDIVLCSTDEPNAAEAATETAPNSSTAVEEIPQNDSSELIEESKSEKRQRRRHNASLSALTDKNILISNSNTEVKLTRQKLKRSQSQTLEGTHSAKGTQKRPKRNRTKPVNKDFVYDLSALLKKEIQPPGISNNECDTYQLRGSKRRNTLNAQFEITPPVPAFEFIKLKHCDAIKGTTRRVCLLLINQGLAASSTLPEIPAERPQMRPRLTSTQRSDSQAGPIIETTELEAARLKSLPLCDDSYLEKIAKESVGSFKIKPCLEQQHSALDSLLQKVDSSKQLNGISRNASNQNQINVQPVDVKDEFNSYTFLSSSLLESGSNNNIALSALPSFLTTPEQAIPKTLSIPIKPQKRLPSLDRLNETINSFENFYNTELKN